MSDTLRAAFLQATARAIPNQERGEAMTSSPSPISSADMTRKRATEGVGTTSARALPKTNARRLSRLSMGFSKASFPRLSMKDDTSSPFHWGQSKAIRFASLPRSS